MRDVNGASCAVSIQILHNEKVILGSTDVIFGWLQLWMICLGADAVCSLHVNVFDSALPNNW